MLLTVKETRWIAAPRAERSCAENKIQMTGGYENVFCDELPESQPVHLGESDPVTEASPSAAVPSRTCCDTEGVHLLSIFPLRGSREFARLSCIAVSEPVTPCRPAFCASREEVLTLLLKVLPAERVQYMLADLDQKKEVQVSISDSDAREVGFLAKIM